jgi:hypothetical protein
VARCLGLLGGRPGAGCLLGGFGFRSRASILTLALITRELRRWHLTRAAIHAALEESGFPLGASVEGRAGILDPRLGFCEAGCAERPVAAAGALLGVDLVGGGCGWVVLVTVLGVDELGDSVAEESLGAGLAGAGVACSLAVGQWRLGGCSGLSIS